MRGNYLVFWGKCQRSVQIARLFALNGSFKIVIFAVPALLSWKDTIFNYQLMNSPVVDAIYENQIRQDNINNMNNYIFQRLYSSQNDKMPAWTFLLRRTTNVQTPKRKLALTSVSDVNKSFSEVIPTHAQVTRQIPSSKIFFTVV